MRYKITSTGKNIIADQSFVDAQYPGDYELIPEEPVVHDNSAEHQLQSDNYASIKVVNINRLLSKGLVAKALKLNGGF